MCWVNNLLSNLKSGLKNKTISVKCHNTRLTRLFLNLLVLEGVVASFSRCPLNKYKLRIFLPEYDFYLRKENTFTSIISYNSISAIKPVFNIKIKLRQSSPVIYKYRSLIKLKKKNKSLIILSTNLGFITLEEVFLYKLHVGGFIICKICF